MLYFAYFKGLFCLCLKNLRTFKSFFSPVVKGNLWGTIRQLTGQLSHYISFSWTSLMLNIVNRRNDFVLDFALKQSFIQQTKNCSALLILQMLSANLFLYQSMHRKDIFRIFCYFDSVDMFGRLFLLHQPSWPFIDIIFKYYVHFLNIQMFEVSLECIVENFHSKCKDCGFSLPLLPISFMTYS